MVTESSKPEVRLGRLGRFAVTFLLVIVAFLLVEVAPLCWGPRALPQEHLIDAVAGKLPRILLIGLAVSAFVSVGLRRRNEPDEPDPPEGADQER